MRLHLPVVHRPPPIQQLPARLRHLLELPRDPRVRAVVRARARASAAAHVVVSLLCACLLAIVSALPMTAHSALSDLTGMGGVGGGGAGTGQGIARGDAAGEGVTASGTTSGAGPLRVGHVEVRLVSSVAQVIPGQPFRIGLQLQHDAHWHTYWRNPGDSGLPTTFDVRTSLPATVRDIDWPRPFRFAIGPMANLGYEGQVLLTREIVVDPTATNGADGGSADARIALKVHAAWLVCRDICIPGETDLALELPVASPGSAASGSSATSSIDAATQQAFEASLASAPRRGETLTAGWHREALAGSGALAGPGGTGTSSKAGADAIRCAPGQQRAWVALGHVDVNASVAQLEFFPYDSDLISVPAPQVWWSTAADGGADQALANGSVLALCLVPPMPGLPVAGNGADPQSVPSGGILVAGDRAVELQFRPLPDAPVLGQRLSEALPLADPTRAGFGAAGTTTAVASTVATPGAASAGMASDGTGPGALPSPGRGSTTAAGTAMVEGTSISAWLASVIGALAGGLILNLMPCVFPVIGLKVLSLAGERGMDARNGGDDRRATRGRALAFAGGVVVSFMMLGLLMILLRALGSGIGWGFQMQSPSFIAALILLFVAIGLNLSGVYEVGLASMAWAAALGERFAAAVSRANVAGAPAPGTDDGRWASALSGALAVLVAAPCTAPFMAGAIGYTLAAPWWASISVFAALGIGMALPYLLLAWRPAMLDRLPRPGAWMEVLRQALAFPMYLTVAWLTWVLAQQTGPDAVLAMLAAVVALGFALWLHGRAQRAPGARHGWRMFRSAMVAVAVAAVVALAWRASTTQPDESVSTSPPSASSGSSVSSASSTAPSVARVQWQPWSAERVAQARSEGQPVLVDFTAAWCISCQVNEKFVLDREQVMSALTRKRVMLLRADWTRFNPQITAALASFGRSGVPLYLYYAPGQQDPVVLPELLTVDAVLGAIGG